MRHLLITASAAALAIAFCASVGVEVAAPFSAGGLTSPDARAVDVGYNPGRPTMRIDVPAAAMPRSASYKRFWPQTLWPPSMRCFRYR